MQTEWILGLDIGGSGSRAALQRLDAPAGQPPLKITGARIEVRAGGIPLPAILESLLPAVRHAVAGQGGQLRAAAVGMSGLLSLTAGTDDVHRTAPRPAGTDPGRPGLGRRHVARGRARARRRGSRLRRHRRRGSRHGLCGMLAPGGRLGTCPR